MNKNLILSIISGLLLAAAWPTYGVSFLIFIAFVPLLLLETSIRASTTKRKIIKVLGYSYITFLFWNGLTTWWLWNSTVFGMLFAVLVNSLLMSMVFLSYHFVATRLPKKIHLIYLPAVWMAFEQLHLDWAFSWPWLNLGNVFSEFYTWIQWYEFTGTFGGTLWVWIVNITLFLCVETYRHNKNRTLLTRGIVKTLLCVAVPIVISLWIYQKDVVAEKTARVVVLQPNVDPYTEKYGRSNYESLTDLLSIAAKHELSKTDFLIAPETTLSKLTSVDYLKVTQERVMINALINQYPNLNFLTGADLFKLYEQREKPSPYANKTSRGDWAELYNAALFFNKETVEVPYYVKSKLVVGVETFPFKNTLEPLLGNIMIDLGGTVSVRAIQEERMVFSSVDKKYKVGPIICYESVFGEFVTEYVKKGANFLAIITNDGWWSDTQGHKQHLSYARLRAIETRKSIARSANTGISAVVNSKGDIIKQLGYEKKGSIAYDLPVNETVTFYVKYGDYLARLGVLLAGFILLFAIARKKG
ncbi:apolipoprotein N-acyltransferase [Flavobacteriaceae bacterium M23B6Z8]